MSVVHCYQLPVVLYVEYCFLFADATAAIQDFAHLPF